MSWDHGYGRYLYFRLQELYNTTHARIESWTNAISAYHFGCKAAEKFKCTTIICLQLQLQKIYKKKLLSVKSCIVVDMIMMIFWEIKSNLASNFFVEDPLENLSFSTMDSFLTPQTLTSPNNKDSLVEVLEPSAPLTLPPATTTTREKPTFV